MSVNEENEEVVVLKWTRNPKSRAAYAELKEIDTEKLTPREEVLLRVINSLEEQLDDFEKKSER
jgi:hypothetical protein